MIKTVREAAISEVFWRGLIRSYAEESSARRADKDNISCVKSICESYRGLPSQITNMSTYTVQLMGEEPLDTLRPMLLKLLNDADYNKQRAAAEITAGIISGSKHWSDNAQQRLWTFLKLVFDETLGGIVQNELLPIWASFLSVGVFILAMKHVTNRYSQYLFCDRDPRLGGPLIDFVRGCFKGCDFNSELPFDAIKWSWFANIIIKGTDWKSTALTEEMISRYWSELNTEHDAVRTFIAEALKISEMATVCFLYITEQHHLLILMTSGVRV